MVGANLRRLRISAKQTGENKLTVERLARLTALNHSSIWRFETGDCGMTIATLARFKEAFDCSWDDLLKGCDSKIVKQRKRFAGEVRKGK